MEYCNGTFSSTRQRRKKKKKKLIPVEYTEMKNAFMIEILFRLYSMDAIWPCNPNPPAIDI